MSSGDYLIQIEGELDWGDLPDADGVTNPNSPSYNTDSTGTAGASHVLDSDLYMGANNVDSEADGQSSAAADGDNTTGNNDEDGVTIPTLIVDRTATVVVESSAAGALNAFFDWNNDGDFDVAVGIH